MNKSDFDIYTRKPRTAIEIAENILGRGLTPDEVEKLKQLHDRQVTTVERIKKLFEEAGIETADHTKGPLVRLNKLQDS